MERALRVILIEDSLEDAFVLERMLNNSGYSITVQRVESGLELSEILGRGGWDVILCDYMLPQFDAVEALRIVKLANIDLPFIVISGKIDEETAVTVLRAGAHDFVTKSNMSRLIPAIEREIREARIREKQLRSEVARIKSEDMYKHLAESISDIFFAFDNKNICTYWNYAAETKLGIGAADAIGRSLEDLLSEPLGYQYQSVKSKIEYATNQFDGEVLIKCIDETKSFEIVVYPSSYGYSIIAHDITSRKKAEELETARSAIEEELNEAQSMRMIKLLTSGVAHEVRNPLNAISVVTEALWQEIGENEDVKVYKDHIQSHVERLNNLMQDLLDLGKPVEKSKNTNVNILDLIKESISSWKCSNTKCPITISPQIGMNDIFVKVDPLRFHQVLLNLLDNASQHSSEGTSIDCSISSTENLCFIKIVDTGIGIKPEHINRLFEPFFSTRKKGTGLGLAIVKHIIEIHGGDISISNNENGPGCNVSLSLPINNNLQDADQYSVAHVENY